MPAAGRSGLIAGGAITRYLGWEYIFYLNVPIGAAALTLVPRLVPDSRVASRRRQFDIPGAITGTTGLVLLVEAISRHRSTAGVRPARSGPWRRQPRCSPRS